MVEYFKENDYLLIKDKAGDHVGMVGKVTEFWTDTGSSLFELQEAAYVLSKDDPLDVGAFADDYLNKIKRGCGSHVVYTCHKSAYAMDISKFVLEADEQKQVLQPGKE